MPLSERPLLQCHLLAPLRADCMANGLLDRFCLCFRLLHPLRA